MFRSFRAMLRDPATKVLALTAVAVIAVGTVVYMSLEHWSFVQALYFSVVTLATVGYGDLHPTTELTQLFTILYILTSLGIIAAFVTELAKHRPPDPVVTGIMKLKDRHEQGTDPDRQ